MSPKSQGLATQWFAILPGVIALSAWAGAAGIGTGVVDFGPAVVARLPFHSSAVAAVALAVVVALPMTFSAWLCSRNA